MRKALPREFAYIIEELLHEAPSGESKQLYYNRVVETIISTGQAGPFIVAISNVIQRLAIDQLHILGDIYDRGPGAHLIMDTLAQYKNFDIQWGNHDALWMGAAAGNDACIANVLRIALRYGNMETLEDGYGINLVPLVTFAMETYGDDPCTVFAPKIEPGSPAEGINRDLLAKMHKAMAVIQFKLEGALIDKYPAWKMEPRKLLDKLSADFSTVDLGGKIYEMLDRRFPTIDPADPYRLTPEEKTLVDKLHHSFRISDKLQRHIGIFFSHGCMYSIVNSNLMFHASVPLNDDGSLKEVEVMGKKFSGVAICSTI